MKRWAVFNSSSNFPDYHAGGMSHFAGSFETEEEAKMFCRRSLEDYDIEDMGEYLYLDSPQIPTQEEFQNKLNERNKKREESLKNPINKAMHDLCKSLEIQLRRKLDD